MTPRKKQSMETKQKIFDTAIQLFSSEPFEQVTINRICKDAGVTTGAFYHHFQSKEEILMIQYDNVDQTFSSLLEDLSCETYVEKLCEYIGYYAQSAKNDGPATVTEVYRMWLVVKKDFPFSYTQGFAGGLFHLVELAIRNGELAPDTEVYDLVMDLMTLVRGVIYNWCQQQGSFDVVQRSTRMTKTYLSSYICT